MLKIQGKEAKEFTLFAVVLCDEVWKNRNQRVWGNQLVDPIKLSIQINRYLFNTSKLGYRFLGKKRTLPRGSLHLLDGSNVTLMQQ